MERDSFLLHAANDRRSGRSHGQVALDGSAPLACHHGSNHFDFPSSVFRDDRPGAVAGLCGRDRAADRLEYADLARPSARLGSAFASDFHSALCRHRSLIDPFGPHGRRMEPHSAHSFRAFDFGRDAASRSTEPCFLLYPARQRDRDAIYGADSARSGELSAAANYSFPRAISCGLGVLDSDGLAIAYPRRSPSGPFCCPRTQNTHRSPARCGRARGRPFP